MLQKYVRWLLLFLFHLSSRIKNFGMQQFFLSVIQSIYIEIAGERAGIMAYVSWDLRVGVFVFFGLVEMRSRKCVPLEILMRAS